MVPGTSFLNIHFVPNLGLFFFFFMVLGIVGKLLIVILADYKCQKFADIKQTYLSVFIF